MDLWIYLAIAAVGLVALVSTVAVLAACMLSGQISRDEEQEYERWLDGQSRSDDIREG